MANKNNQEYVNVSIPGVSTQWIVQKLFAYFREYGNPEVIACLFPDLYRMSIPLRRGEFHAEHNRHSSIANIQMGSNGLKLDKPKYSKVPHIAEDVIPAEVPLYFSFQYITMLEQYCNSNGIKLVWSSWDFVLNEIVEKYQQHGLFKNYVSIDNNRWFSQPAKDILYQNSSNKGSSHDQFAPQETCHEEYRELYDGYFDKGSDIELGAGSRHMGAHRHMHIAEAFLSALEKQ
jgi:hypothetical protein